MIPLPDYLSETTIRHQVRQALDEDVGPGDLTAHLVPADRSSDAHVVTRERGVLAGRRWFDEVFAQLDPDIRIDWAAADGDVVAPNQLLCRLYGNARRLLTGERTALNFLQTLSGTATAVHEYVEAVAGTGVHILDTRKTLPGLRLAQKYAVVCGGGRNHRIGLFDAILIKENHIMAAGSIHAAIEEARHHAPDVLVEVEVETIEQLREALAGGVDRVLLDNMGPDLLREAVTLTEGRAGLEASGGITRDNIRAIAETGVDFISIGATTKDVRALDLSMRFDELVTP